MIIREPVTEPTAVTLEPVPTAVVRHRGVTVADLPALFDAAYPAIGASGAAIAGPAFAVYRGDPSARFDLEIGFPVTSPVAGPIAGPVTVEPSELPVGPSLTLSHLGSYDALHEGWGRLAGEAAAQGLVPRCFFEVYVTEPTPDTDPATLRTDLYLMV